jgi:hypothetical protein
MKLDPGALVLLLMLMASAAIMLGVMAELFLLLMGWGANALNR